MADGNNKISIDIEINANGQQQINQYKNAFDGLRTSINNLSSPISKLDGEISKLTQSISDLGVKNQTASDTINKVLDASGKAKTSYEALTVAVNFFRTGVIAMESALTAGLSVVIAFLPEIINFATALFKGKDAVNAMALSFQNLNAARKTANADAATETTTLQFLYKSATDVKNSHDDRVKSMQALQQAYPQHFKGLKEEDFLNGKSKIGFDAATRSILENARAKAALSKITNEANKIANAEYQIEKIKAANYNEVKRRTDEIGKRPKSGRGAGAGNELDIYKKESDERAKVAIAEQEQIIEASKNSVKSLTAFGGGTNKIASVIAGNANISEQATFNYVEKKKPKQQPEPKLPPRKFEELDAKSPGFNFDIDTNKSEAQKQGELNGLNVLDPKMDPEVKKTQATQEEIHKIEEYYAKKRADLEDGLASAKIHAGDKFIDAALKNSKKDSAIYKAAFLAKKATAIADTIISTKRAIMDSLKGYASLPFIGQALGIIQAAFMAGQGAMSVAEISKQKPGFAKGGQFKSDGRGAFLSGYSRVDDTNAYLRSGEAVVVSEAMRDPWARNLVSAINVAYGGRDFSMSNPARGYAIGGIFTDGGNSNRYYNQPMNDQKDLANTIAYQMINNFPPVYVDVKDINSQQNILAQTINRVNL